MEEESLAGKKLNIVSVGKTAGTTAGYEEVSSFKKKGRPRKTGKLKDKEEQKIDKYYLKRLMENIDRTKNVVETNKKEQVDTSQNDIESNDGYFSDNEIFSLAESNTEMIEKRVNKICVYTCIIGEYDRLKPVLFKDPKIDYICFVDVDRKCYENLGWQIRKIPFDLSVMSNVMAQRKIKILPHVFLPEYDISVWVDGTLQIVGDVYAAIKNIFLRNSGKTCFIRVHPERDCIYQEASVCKLLGKADPAVVDKQMSIYKNEGFPEHFGLAETNVLMRKHNDPLCVNLMNMWFDELSKYTHRDQLCFNYCVWKLKFSKLGFLDLIQDKFFNGIIEHRQKHNKKVDIYITNFNTTDLVNLLIRSIIRHVQSLNYRIKIIDNSDTESFSLDRSIDLEGHDVEILDNTKKKLFNTDYFIQRYSKVNSLNNYASFRHAIAIQWILDHTNCDDIILLDSDVVIKKDIDFVNDKFVTIADVGSNNWRSRFLPFIQYFNVKEIKKLKLKYLDVDRMHGGRDVINSRKYDTGASFYEDITHKKIAYRTINHHAYVDHLQGGSWKKKHVEEFIKKESVYG